MKNKIAATQLRIPEETYKYIQQEAARLGIAQNALILILIDRGIKLWEADPILPAER